MPANPYALDGFGEGFERGLRIVYGQQDRELRQSELTRQHTREDAADAAAAKRAGMEEEKFGMEKEQYRKKNLSDLEKGALSIYEKYKDDPEGYMKALAPLNEEIKKYNGGVGFESYAKPEAGNYLKIMSGVVQGQIDKNDPSVLEAVNWRYKAQLNKGLGPVKNNFITEDGVEIPIGSEILSKEAVEVVPGPNGTFTFELLVKGKRPDGSVFEYRAPMTEARENGGKDGVKFTSLNRVMDQVTADSFLRKVATQPEFQDALKASYLAHGGDKKEFEGPDVSVTTVPVGSEGDVQTVMYESKGGKIVKVLGQGNRYGLGKGGKGGASSARSAYLELVANKVFGGDQGNPQAFQEAYNSIVRGDASKAIIDLTAKLIEKDAFDTPEEAKEFSETAVTNIRAFEPNVPPSGPGSKKSHPMEGKKIVNDDTGQILIMRNGEWVPEKGGLAPPPKKRKGTPEELKSQNKRMIEDANIEYLQKLLREKDTKLSREQWSKAKNELTDLLEKRRKEKLLQSK